MSINADQLDQLTERLNDTEARIRLLVNALTFGIDEVNVNNSFFDSYSFIALTWGMTAKEQETIERLFSNAATDESIDIENFKKLYSNNLPRHKDTLKQVAKGYLIESKFPYLSQRILGSYDKPFDIVTINLLGASKNNTDDIDISISISTPYWVIEGEEAACNVKIVPLYENLQPISGTTLFQALKLALDLSNSLLKTLSNEYKLSYYNGKTYFLEDE